MPKTKHADIVNYWVSRQDECGLAVDWAEAHERCWRCGYKSRLHRCHIVPNAQGGPDEPSNLVLLCGRCHREAPNVADPSFMWLWLALIVCHSMMRTGPFGELRSSNECSIASRSRTWAATHPHRHKWKHCLLKKCRRRLPTLVKAGSILRRSLGLSGALNSDF